MIQDSNLNNSIQTLLKYLLVIVFILSLDTLGWLGWLKAPIEQGIAWSNIIRQPIVRTITLPIRMVSYYRHGQARITDLESRLAEALVSSSNNTELLKENQDLRMQLNAPLPKDLDYVVAPVIGSSEEEIIIGAGSIDGVKENDTVVYEDIYIGRVISVSKRISSVSLAGTSQNILAANISGSTSDGLINIVNKQMFLTQVLQADNITPGSIVVTKGDNNVLSRLVIGRVESVEPAGDGIHVIAKVIPALEPQKLFTVFITSPDR